MNRKLLTATLALSACAPAPPSVNEVSLGNFTFQVSILGQRPVFKKIGLRETLEVARTHPHYKAPLGKNQGRGVACGFWFNAGMQASAIVSVNADGSAVVRTGNPDIGGSRVSLALMAAEEIVRGHGGDDLAEPVRQALGDVRVRRGSAVRAARCRRRVVDRGLPLQV